MSAVAQRSASVVLTPRGDVCCQDAGAELARDASTLDMKDNQSIVVHNSGVSTIVCDAGYCHHTSEWTTKSC